MSRISSYLILVAVFAIAAAFSLLAASFAVTAIEENTEIGVRDVLDENDLEWAEVQADGLRVMLAGTAPSEAQRFRAISVTGRVVDAARIIDTMEVKPTAALASPRFSVEILRNDSGISIIGLIPAATNRSDMIERLTAMADGKPVIDLLETAEYPVPRGWADALGFSLTALSRLPRSKVSVDAGRVAITAISDSPEAKTALEAELNRAAPPGLRVTLDIAAPRPVITPFTLRFVIDAEGARFDACSADTPAAQERILEAAGKAGLEADARCVVGMGVPSPDWSLAAEQAIGAVAELGSGSVTFSDADVTLVAAEGTGQALFDRVVGELETGLPDVFSLHAVLPVPSQKAEQGPPEFTATLSPEGNVQLRGRLNSENLRSVADSFAKSRFGSDRVYTAARVVSDLPPDWPVRALAGLEALAMLSHGSVVVTPDTVRIQGVTSNPDARASIASLLSDKLGEAKSFEIDITLREPTPEEAPPANPQDCIAAIALIQIGGKITFEPGSTSLDAASRDTMDRIAEVLAQCGDIELEIQGHTDSQGRESMNQQLSQQRAQSVLNELRNRRIITSSFTAVGYGESRPIADNGTEEGREANRRIEFRLIERANAPPRETTLESVESDTPAEPTDR